MKKTTLIISLTLALACLFAACAEPQPSTPTENPPQTVPSEPIPEPAPLPEPEPAPTKDTSLTLTISDIPDADANDTDYHRFVQDEDGINLVITPNTPIRAFRFVSAIMGETDFTAGDTLYTLDEVTPDKPFMVKMLFVGAGYTYGVIFEDANGFERFFTINLDGRGADEVYPYFLTEVE
jgi:hypothetical protein